MVITIDGPAGAGKSSVARGLARRLGFCFLDTGAMYRVVALAALERSVPMTDGGALAELADSLDIDVAEHAVCWDGQDVTDAIRTTQVTSVIHYVADHPAIREKLVNLQREIAARGNFVTEGRDQGTVAFPKAICKFFLTASPHVRARRRMEDLQRRGENVSLEEVLSRQNERDERDATRSVGALVMAEDAIEFNTDGLTIDEVIGALERLVREKLQDASGTRGSHPT